MKNRSNIRKLVKTSPFLIRLRHWEYWPFFITYLPVGFYWLYLSLKARSPFFFSASNPGIETGGLFGESKINILDRVPEELKPKTLFFNGTSTVESVKQGLIEHAMDFPVIVKPDIGERGFLVEKVNCLQELASYFQQNKAQSIVQEYVTFPEEYNILYYRFPGAERGAITSITIKEFLTVVGDGQSTVKELMEKRKRACLQIKRLEDTQPELLNHIPRKGEELLLEPIGNHTRGTKFVNGNHLIDESLVNTFDEVAKQIDGIYFFRFDVRCASFEELKSGNFKILEINGCGGEPSHVYDPEYPLLSAYKDLFEHWKIIYRIGIANKKRGIDYMTFSEAIRSVKSFRRYKQSAKA